MFAVEASAGFGRFEREILGTAHTHDANGNVFRLHDVAALAGGSQRFGRIVHQGLPGGGQRPGFAVAAAGVRRQVERHAVGNNQTPGESDSMAAGFLPRGAAWIQDEVVALRAGN